MYGGASPEPAPEPAPHLLDLPDELWAKHILSHAGASELVRLQRVCRALHQLASHAFYQPVIHAERERRESARVADRDRRRRDYRYNCNLRS